MRYLKTRGNMLSVVPGAILLLGGNDGWRQRL